MHSSLLLSSLFCLCSLSLASEVTDLDVELVDGGPDFKVYVNDETWFRSGQMGVRHKDVWWSSENTESNILKIADYNTTDGEDSMGRFVKRRFLWNGHSSAKSSTVDLKLETAILVYEDAPAIVFDTVYLTGLSNVGTSEAASEGVLSSFPSFVLDAEERKKGWMTWSGTMTSNIRFGEWEAGKSVYGSIDGGFPLAVFDSTMKAAVVMSPFNSFMAATQASINSTIKKNETHVALGLLPSITTVPAGYKYKTIMVAAGNVTGAMRRFGEVLRREYKKEDHYRKADYSINYLGYWTDNGACYYYYSGKNYSDYEELLVAVKEDADSSGIPFRYVQLDSWWYFKGKGGGVKNWTAMPDIFPNGIGSMVEKTGWPVVGHNRYWSTDTDYAQKFNFIVEEHGALPNDTMFWDYLISSTLHSFKLIVYEQDWLNVQVNEVKALQTDLFLGEQWLVDMGAAAERHGLTIQYCMPWPRHVLQSVMVPVVTQYRVSGDYAPDNNQWIVGDSSILAHSVGLAAFKDNFRTSSYQSDCASKYHTNETSTTLETYVATMTGGPVGPSDMIGTANVTLINATCMQDGRILKPSHPAMSLDSTFLRRAFGEMGPTGQMTAAFTEIDGLTWYYVMAADMEADYALSAAELPPSHSTFPASKLKGMVFQYSVASGEPFGIEELTEDNTITVEKCGKEDFKFFVVAPLLRNGMAVFGELSKFVTVSEVRFTSVEVTEDGGVATLVGVPSEKVTVTVYTGKSTVAVECVIGSSGYAQLTISHTPSCA